MKILIEVIPHQSQRYNTPGDWRWKDGNLRIAVSDTGNERMNFLLIIHELVEALLCNVEGIDQNLVDSFDRCWTMTHGEPGNDLQAPYHYQHVFAENIERLLALRFDVNWEIYGEKVDETVDGWGGDEPQRETPAFWAKPWHWIRGGENPSVCSVCGVEQGTRHVPELHREASPERG